MVIPGTRRCTLCAVDRKRRVTLWATDICGRRLCRSSEEITRIAILLTPRRATAGARRAFHGTFTTGCWASPACRRGRTRGQPERAERRRRETFLIDEVRRRIHPIAIGQKGGIGRLLPSDQPEQHFVRFVDLQAGRRSVLFLLCVRETRRQGVGPVFRSLFESS